MNLSQIIMFYIVLAVPLITVQSDGLLYHEQLNVQELEILFDEEKCIEGTLSVSEMDSVGFQTLSFIEVAPKINELSENTEDKSAMSMLNELAFYNKIKYQYILTREEGPAHRKQFNVSLHLGEEEYSAKGSSIKKAQHSAARQALRSTIYNHPPNKDIKELDKTPKSHNPVQNLENWVSKHVDASVIYYFQGQSSRSHKNFYHGNMYSKPSIYKVTVAIGKLEFTGEGFTLDAAKQKAANNALKELNNANGFCLLGEKYGMHWSQFFNADVGNDSPISFIHEFATRSKLEVSFELIREEGPSHMKTFTFKCSIGEKFVSFGKGSHKKTAKQEAAIDMIKHLKSHAYDNHINCGSIFRKNKKNKNHNSKKLIKAVQNIASEKEYQYSFPDDYNPISKLMQIQQVNYDMLPVFTLLEERGKKVKEFFVEVKVGNEVFVGSGPNKKTAKKKAAEGMLKILGYTHSSEGFRVPLSEKKRNEFSNKLDTTMPKMPLASGINLNSEAFSRKDHDQRSNPSDEYKKIKKVDSKIVFNDNSAKTKNKKYTTVTNVKSLKTQLENISQKLVFRFQFSDFPKSNNTGSGFVSLLSLTTDPPKVCYGTGLTTDVSQVKATEAALEDLYKSHVSIISEILQEPLRDTVSEEWFNFGDKIVQQDVK